MVWAALRQGGRQKGTGADVNTLRASGLGIADIFGLWALLRKPCHLRDWFYEDGTSCRCGGRHPKVDMLGNLPRLECWNRGGTRDRLRCRAGSSSPVRFRRATSTGWRGPSAAPTAGAAPSATRGAADIGGLAEPLSGRELEVLRLLAEGKSNQQIAEELVVSLATVKKHVGHILGKLAAANRTQAAACARVLGLLR
jgi:DNA-binding CsgD family transcriptional regulator